ncbi:MAG: peptidase E [Chloroflexi bacterium]|nr:peptidase E [Chloroflexota bacterium]MBV9595711.1 peptidase E [Chloroflexota bacterium]
MPAEIPTIVATSIGIPLRPRLPLDRQAAAIYRLALDLAQPRETPRICFLATAVGDASESLVRAYIAFSELDVRFSHLSLFPMPNVEDVRGHLLRQDVIWVGGGSVANLLAVWRAHGLDRSLHECWQAGIVLGGVSAGSLCWHVGGTTDSFGLQLQPITDGLGWLPYANGVHYDSEAQRRPLLEQLVAQGRLPTAYATDDGVGLVYRGTHMAEAVANEEGKAAYLVERTADGGVHETRIAPRLLI